MKEINIFTDGSCLKNPGQGSAAMILLLNKEIFHQKSEYFSYTTNNQMELRAVIMAFESLEELKLQKAYIYCDSQYTVNGYNLWMASWQKNQWEKNDKQKVLNQNLWEKLFNYKTQLPNVQVQWVKAHSKKTDFLSIWNDSVDKLARQTICLHTN